MSHPPVHSAAELGARLRSRRRELGITQSEVAAVIGTNRRVIGQLEHGKPTVQLRIALDAAGVLGLDLQPVPRR
jgi:HTH-type transcriptional regulator/antitoxin HipB